MKLQKIKGTTDFFSHEMKLFNIIINIIKIIVKNHSYDEVSTPAMEYTKLFLHTLGSSSDIIGKEMYSRIQ